MTAEQFRAALATLALSRNRAAQACGKDRSTIYRYLDGSIPIPDTVARRMNVLLRRGKETVQQQYPSRDCVRWRDIGKPTETATEALE